MHLLNFVTDKEKSRYVQNFIRHFELYFAAAHAQMLKISPRKG